MRQLMINTVIILASVFAQICAAQPVSQSDLRTGKKGSSYPPFVLNNGTRKISSDSIQGKVIWMNFWFEACKPCMAEMKAIYEINERFKNEPDFLFLSITMEKEETINRVRRKLPLSYAVFTVSNAEAERLIGGRGYPTNIIIGKDGRIMYIETGGRIEPAAARDDLINNVVPIIKKALKK